MFDIGMQELIVIFIIALIIFGPQRLPELGRTLGKMLAELRGSLQDIKEKTENEFKETVDTSDIQDVVKSGTELKKSLRDVKERLETEFKETIEPSVAQNTGTGDDKKVEKKGGIREGEQKEGAHGR